MAWYINNWGVDLKKQQQTNKKINLTYCPQNLYLFPHNSTNPLTPPLYCQWMCLCRALMNLNILYGSNRKSYSIPIVFHITGDRLSAILNSIQSGPFLPAPSIFEQAAKPPSSLVHSPFVFGQSLSQQPQPQPQLLSKSGPLWQWWCLLAQVHRALYLFLLFNISVFLEMSVLLSGLGFLLFCLFSIIRSCCIFQ